MRNRRTSTLLAGALVATATVIGCRDTLGPPTPTHTGPSLHETPPPPHDQANFRLTGGGRVDVNDHLGHSKNTPESHDFATFGFQARPTGSGTAGSGNITWVEHNPAAPGGGFTFHGRVEWFTATTSPECGKFGGTGRAHLRDGNTYDNLVFEVEHACDLREPGVGAITS